MRCFVLSDNIAWINGLMRQAYFPIFEFFVRKQRIFLHFSYQDESILFPKRFPLQLRKFSARVQARNETVDSRLKTFHVLSQRVCHKIDSHGMCFHDCDKITQINLAIQPLFSI